MDLRKGNLIFLKTPLADLIYVVRECEGEVVVAKKMDSPPNTWERLPSCECVRLAEEQEKLLPAFLLQVIQEQRQIVFAPPKKPGLKKKKSMESILKGLEKETLEEIFNLLSDEGVTEE